MVRSDKHLGVQERYSMQKDNSVMNERALKCRAVAHRVQRLPLSMDAKDTLVAMCATACILHGAEQGFPSVDELLKCRSAVARAVRGEFHKMRSVEIVFSVCLKGHRSDPLQALPYEALVVFRRLVI